MPATRAACLLAAAALAGACGRPAEPVAAKATPPAATRSTDAAPASTTAPAAGDAAPDGAGVALNTRKWRYATFFSRLRRAVIQQWNPTPAMLNGPVPLGPDGVTTVVLIVLTPAGDVSDVGVQSSSGHPALDAEGQRAVRAAGPFRNPPPGLADTTSGQISFAFRLHYQR